MRVPNHLHQQHPWVMAEIAPDFGLLDAWAIPAEGGREDFEAFVATVTSLDPARAASAPTRTLFALRMQLGRWFGWDDDRTARPIPGCTETSLSVRLPEHLRGSATGLAFGGAHGFIQLYRTADEWAAETSNATVHGVLQLSWIDQGNGRYAARLAVYIKPRGAFGRAYVALIAPFRHLVVYPAMLRQIGSAWRNAAA